MVNNDILEIQFKVYVIPVKYIASRWQKKLIERNIIEPNNHICIHRYLKKKNDELRLVVKYQTINKNL